MRINLTLIYYCSLFTSFFFFISFFIRQFLLGYFIIIVCFVFQFFVFSFVFLFWFWVTCILLIKWCALKSVEMENKQNDEMQSAGQKKNGNKINSAHFHTITCTLNYFCYTRLLNYYLLWNESFFISLFVIYDSKLKTKQKKGSGLFNSLLYNFIYVFSWNLRV